VSKLAPQVLSVTLAVAWAVQAQNTSRPMPAQGEYELLLALEVLNE